MTGSGSLTAQVAVSLIGLALMTLVATYISWSKQQDEPLHKAPAARVDEAAFPESIKTRPLTPTPSGRRA
jgi:hypothetical protein